MSDLNLMNENKENPPKEKSIGRTLKELRLPAWSSILLYFVLPYFAFYLLEVFTHDPFAMKPKIQGTNYLVFLALQSLFFVLFGTVKRAVRATALLAYFVGLANYLVISFRGTPIVPWDYKSLDTAVSVLGTYEFPWSEAFWTSTIAFVFVWLLAGLLVGELKFKLWRALGLAAVLTCMIGLVTVIQDDGFAKKIKLDNTLFTPGFMYRTNGFSLAFIRNFSYMTVPEPTDYSIDRVNEIIDEYMGRLPVSLRKGIDLSTVRPETDLPNIVVVMSEGFSDLQQLAEFSTNEDYMPYFNSLEENVVRGNLHSSIIGGNTATSEYEFLTSDSMAFLPTGSVAYQQFIFSEMPTLNQVLEDQGYHSVAMHPYGASGWERDQVYEHFSFDKVKFINDFKHRKKIRNYVSDEALFKEILMELEEAPTDQPSFIFTVSMQNHGGYSKRFDDFDVNVELTEEGNFDWVNHYLSLIQETDRQLEIFFDALNDLEEDTVVLFFGDHQPNDATVRALERLDSYSDDPTARHIVPYLIWANYEIDTSFNGRDSSLNFMAGNLLRAAGVETSPYMDFLLDLQEEIPIMTGSYIIDASEQIHFIDGDESSFLSPHLQNLLYEYEVLQYNHLIDIKQRVNAIFSAK